LDVGCGTGFNLTRLRRLEAPFASYLGVDLTPEMLAIARRKHADEPRAAFVRMDLRDLDALDSRFDIVICTWVVSHLVDPQAGIAVMCDLLADDGRALLLMMTRPRWSLRWWLAPLVRIFRARFVDPAVFDGLRGKTRVRRFAAGLVALLEVRRTSAGAAR